MTKAIILEEQKGFFRDEASFDNFVQVFRDAVESGDLQLVLLNREVMFALISPADAQEMLCQRIVDRLAKNPELLETLKARLESDDFVE